MTQFSSWRANQKKNRPKIKWEEIIQAGKKKRSAEWLCPEWLWISIFLAFIIALGFIMTNIDRFDPGEALKAREAQLEKNEVKEPLDANLTATEDIKGIVKMYGVASWYDYALDGDVIGNEWSKSHDTCASKGWNRYGKLKVTNLDNGKSVECYVNDNGPRDCEYRYKYKLDRPGECVERLIDLSSHAFNQIADPGLGLINVSVEKIYFY